MSIRARLTLFVVALLGAGLVMSAATTNAALRRELFRRVDAQIREVEPYARQQLLDKDSRAPTSPAAQVPQAAVKTGASVDVLVARIDRNGDVVDRIVPPLSGRSPILDAVPTKIVLQAIAGTPRWADVSIDDEDYRVLVRRFGTAGDVAAVVAPLHDVESTLGHLRRLELLGGAVLLALGGVAAWWIVGLGLRPLRAMADAAGAIAAGEADRRVPAGSGQVRGEVPRLAAALNGAFDARNRSEDQLRRFITDASHELRTPLTSIQGYAELYRAGAFSEPADAGRALARIEAEAGRMGALVEDLLLLAWLDQGPDQASDVVDLLAIATDAVADSMAAGPAWPVTLVGRGPVAVQGDEARLRQVLANLLANARQHCPDGTAIEVSVGHEGDAGVVRVTDDGPGLPPGAQERVFDRFWRADPARGHQRGGGAGLGLSIVRAIVEAHGGRVEVGAGPGRGARFTVRLPVVSGPRPA